MDGHAELAWVAGYIQRWFTRFEEGHLGWYPDIHPPSPRRYGRGSEHTTYSSSSLPNP